MGVLAARARRHGPDKHGSPSFVTRWAGDKTLRRPPLVGLVHSRPHFVRFGTHSLPGVCAVHLPSANVRCKGMMIVLRRNPLDSGTSGPYRAGHGHQLDKRKRGPANRRLTPRLGRSRNRGVERRMLGDMWVGSISEMPKHRQPTRRRAWYSGGRTAFESERVVDVLIRGTASVDSYYSWAGGAQGVIMMVRGCRKFSSLLWLSVAGCGTTGREMPTMHVGWMGGRVSG